MKKLNKVDPQGWLTDVLGRIAQHKINRIDELCLGTFMRIQRPEDAYEKRGVCDLGDGYVAPGRVPKTMSQISKLRCEEVTPPG